MTPQITDPLLLAAIDHATDPIHAHAVMDQLAELAPEELATMATHAAARDACVAVICASRSLTRAFLREPALLGTLLTLDGEPTESALRADVAHTLAGASDPADALRRWKQRELIRITARDLLGLADLASVGRELAALAQACLHGAVLIAAPTIPFAVIGMGKLGGRELNYSSDVDVLFVHDGPQAEGERAAKAVLVAMSTPMPSGIVFRTDAALRPEGRAGALSRSIDSYYAYWDQWAQAWERQALIKARPVAGDAALGERFATTAFPFVWSSDLDPDAVRSVRAMKARSEELLRNKGLDTREIKRGTGGIRDIEFAVQILQLVHGRHDETIRSPNTLTALDALATGGYIERDDAEQLDSAYRWLRTVEHRLQLVDEQQTHTLPVEPMAQTNLAHTLGIRGTELDSAWEQFQSEHRIYQRDVRAIHERLFFRPLLERLADTGPLSPEAATDRLAAFGFVDAERTRTAVKELGAGHGRRAQLMQQLLPLLLDWCSTTPDPDLALLQLRKLVDDEDRARPVIAAFRDVPNAAERTCIVLGASRVVGDALIRQPEMVAMLGDDAFLAEARTADELLHEALATLEWRTDESARRRALRYFKRREFVRIAARDLLGFCEPGRVSPELSNLADAAFEAALRALQPAFPVAVIGMGRLGGRELSYASDVDVLFVYDGTNDHAAAEAIAAAVVEQIGALTPEGQTFRVDLALRPEGKGGTLARSLDGYREYYAQYAMTWERQSLVRARAVAGDPDLAAAFVELANATAYRDPFPEADAREIRKVKARVERERIPPGEDPQLHLKLGRGGLVDVEFTAQLLQLQVGGSDKTVRTPSTIGALVALRDAGALSSDDCVALLDAYQFCDRARNARFLLTGRAVDSLPSVPEDAQKLGRLMGYLDHPQVAMREDYKRVTRRARAVVERVFYEASL